MAYIPQGCDQQGRHRVTGIWAAPHRTHDDSQAAIDGAHAASDIQGAEPMSNVSPTTGALLGLGAMLVSAIVAVLFAAWVAATTWEWLRPVLVGWGWL
jgi:hypothetical protein